MPYRTVRGRAGGSTAGPLNNRTKRMSVCRLLSHVLNRCVAQQASCPLCVFLPNCLSVCLSVTRDTTSVGGCSTAGPTVTATKRSIAHNATSGIASPPRAWSIATGQCSGTCPPPGAAVSSSSKRDQEAARSNRRESPSSVLVTSQWCAQPRGW